MSRSLVDNIVDLYRHDDVDPFWDKQPEPHYSELNGVEAPTDQMIQEYQLSKIEDLQRAALTKKGNISMINELFTNKSINTMKFSQDEQMQLNKSISNIVRMINSTYSDKTGSKKNDNIQYKYDSLLNHLTRLQTELKNIQQQLKIKDTVYEENLQSLAQAIKDCEMHSLSEGGIEK